MRKALWMLAPPVLEARRHPPGIRPAG